MFGVNKTRLLSILLVSTLLFSGCTNPLGPPEPTSSLTVDLDQINVGETVNFDARESTTPESTVIVQYDWDFGDGTSATTTSGLTNHIYSQPGTYDVSVEVSNDQGGSDSSSWTINVNAYPVISLLVQPDAKVGESITLDASNSYDPEGGVISWLWDLNLDNDSDGDGIKENDADSFDSSIIMLMNKSGQFKGSVAVTDDRDTTTIETFTINVSTRTWKITWEQQRVSYNWDGYLKQGESWSHVHQPGSAGRLIEVNATLTLTMDMLPTQQPQDNFTLYLLVPSGGWEVESQTSQENITKPPKAFIERDGMNPLPNASVKYQADHSDDVLSSLFEDAGSRFGVGNWTWRVTADQADPDFPIDVGDMVDPDEGNDWQLDVEFVILIPRISEVFS